MELPPLGPKSAAIAAQSATRSARDVASDPDAPARAAAKAFEATFLAEMLKDTGLNAMPTELGGGGAGDNPVFIEQMFAFFQQHARGSVAEDGVVEIVGVRIGLQIHQLGGMIHKALHFFRLGLKGFSSQLPWTLRQIHHLCRVLHQAVVGKASY